jgi:hypothetical protein
MMISWWSKYVGVILSVLMCDIWINVLLLASALVGPLHIVNWNARWNSEINRLIVYDAVVSGRKLLKVSEKLFASIFHREFVAIFPRKYFCLYFPRKLCSAPTMLHGVKNHKTTTQSFAII